MWGFGPEWQCLRLIPDSVLSDRSLLVVVPRGLYTMLGVKPASIKSNASALQYISLWTSNQSLVFSQYYTEDELWSQTEVDLNSGTCGKFLTKWST